MSKKTIYTIFLAKFIFSLLLIFWTIKMTMTAGVGTDDDNSFLSSYHVVDENYNKIFQDNIDFNKLYDTTITINDEKINSMTYKDIYLSQRVIKHRDIRKHILKLKNNKISIQIKNKKTNKIIKNINANIVITRPSTHDDDIKFNLKNSNDIKEFEINKKAYWNIMGKVVIDDIEGLFYIKTNSK